MGNLESAQAMEKTAEDLANEVGLNEEILRLWDAQKDHDAIARKTREDLKAIRRSLAERLHAMKTMLAQTGRSGRWASYLREHEIPRATADRYVRQHELTLVLSQEKRLSEAISPAPTDEDVRRLFRKLQSQMQKVLTNQDAAFTFVIEMIYGLPGINGDVLDEGVIVFRPKEDSGPIPESLGNSAQVRVTLP